MKSIFILILFGAYIISPLYSQNQHNLPSIKFGNIDKKHQTWEMNISNGLIFYTGDIHSATIAFKETHPCFAASIYYHLTDNFSSRGSLLYGQLSGSDLNYGTQHGNRNFTFSSNIVEIAPSVLWEPWGHKKNVSLSTENYKFGRLSPYIHLGFGILLIQPKVNYFEESNFYLKNKITQDKLNTTQKHFIIPFGIGWRYDLNSSWTIRGEGSFRVPFTDYLDGISLSANPLKNDWYSVATLSIGYKIKYNKDKDKDGIPDEIDECPELPGFPSAKGCPDQDNDGILDKDDFCPDDKGLINLKGCPDQDNDGVADYEDHCPYNAGLKKLNGCPDRDKDGVVDYKDLCPDLAGSIIARGCPDQDNDGIMDKQDKCPTEKGTIALDGCPSKDWDDDGIPDYADACPDKAGDKANNGCPMNSLESNEKIIQEYTQPISKNITENKNDSLRRFLIQNNYYTRTKSYLSVAESKISFLNNATKIKDESYPTLNAIIEILKKDLGVRLEINVFSIDTKDTFLNKKLSDARSRTIYYFFVKNGIAAERLKYKGVTSTMKNINEKNTQKDGIVEFNLF
jgi:outer membrane protein OmpA-like peptidoglycan-associated protein